MADCLAHVALAGLTALAWLGLGSLILAPVRTSGDRLLEGLNRLGVGALAFALLTFAAGFAGLLYPAAYLPVFALTALAGLRSAARLLDGAALPRLRAWRRWQLGLGGLLAVYVAVDVFSTCAPISSADALFYHAAAPSLFEQAHHLRELPWSSQSYQPFTVEMLVLDGFLLWDSVQGAFAPLLLALAALATVLGAARRIAGRPAALLAGAVFFAQPFMVWQATSTFAEPGLAFAIALASWNLWRFVRQADRRALVLAGIFAGGAAGMKYTGAVAAVALAVAGALLARRRLRTIEVLAFGLPAIAIALPWYVKNAIQTGNPVYPLLFGGLNREAAASLDQTLHSYGYGRSALDALLLPVQLLARADAFDRGDFLSPLFLVFAPLAFLAPRARRPAGAVWTAILLYAAVWFFSSQQARFLVQLMPALAVLAAVGILALAGRGRLGRIAAVAAVSGALATGLAVSSVYASQFARVVVGSESERAFLARKAPYDQGIDWLNRNLGKNEKVLIDFTFVLYLERPYVVWTLDVLPRDAGPEATRAFARATGVTVAAVLASDRDRRRQLGYLHARPIARVPVRFVISRTLSELGPVEPMVVYALPPSR